ncbi:MAG: DUF397 domain-containing protein [Pseudonocardiaceae bacterium]
MTTARFQDGAWFTSSYTNGGQDDCVEVNYSLPEHVGVRDSKLGTASPVLAVPSVQWVYFITDVKGGALDA